MFRPAIVLLVLLGYFGHLRGQGKFSWMRYDRFDEVNDHLRTVDAQNCRSKSKEELVLRPDTVAQLPVYNELLDRVWYKNRSTLIHLHNMALNRAMFYSYVLQKMNDSASFYLQPNWLYMYMSVTADINANPSMVNGSAIYFDRNCHYPNWYTTVHFNKTLPLFGPKAWRHDDFQDQDNLLREPTHRVVEVADMGAGKNLNYTHPLFKMNPWYSKWLPDLSGALDSLTKFTYYVGIKYSNETGRFINDEFQSNDFFGPSMPSAEEKDERLLPVVFTQPYFDCGASNQWVVSTVSPIVDYMPRYTNWTHLRRQRYVGVVVMDTYFLHLDFNACGVSAGNPGPSYLSGIHRCRATTGCKHKMGYGFRRGGYICHCAPGRRYPWSIDPPYQGDNIEQATEEEYRNGFTCSPVDFRQVLPLVERLNGSDVEDAVYTGIVKRMSTLTDSNFNSRNKRSVNETSHFRNRGHGDLHDGLPSPAFKTNTRLQSSAGSSHTGSTIAIDCKNKKRSDRRSKRSTFINKINQEDHEDKEDKPEFGSDNSKDDPDDLIPVRPPVEVPRGMHVDRQATHDHKPITRDQLLAAQQRHEGEAAQQKRTKETTVAPTSGSLPQSRRKRAAVFDQQAFDRVTRIFRQKAMVTKDNCYTMARHNLFLAGDVAYGANKQFEPEARTALRLSHFLSNFLQNTGPMENFGHLRGGGRLHVEHVFGEVIANVMSNHKIYSCGVFFDRYKFENQDGSAREFFGPWAFRGSRGYKAIDMAGMSSRYVNEDWFLSVKNRWATNFKGLETYKMRPYIRSDPAGKASIRHEYFPLIYKAPAYASGYWTRPYFRCDGSVDAWVITYVTPFFGYRSTRRKLEFKGVVTVDVPLDLLELNQCPQSFGVANAFKNTARCDSASTKCSTQTGFPFQLGAYRCDCRQGFEYHHLDGKFWIEGFLLESEYRKKVRGLFSRFDELRCRVSAGSGFSYSAPLLAMGILLLKILQYEL